MKFLFYFLIFIYSGLSHSGTVDERIFFQKQVGTNWVKGYSITSGGKLTGCSIEFNSFIHDTSYVASQLSAVSGSYTLYFMPEKLDIRIGLKLVVNDYKYGAEKVEPNSPFFATIKTSGTKKFVSAFLDSTESDTPGGKLFVYGFDASTEEVLNQIYKNKLTILFNRKEGAMDLIVPLDLTVVSKDENGRVTRSKTNMSDFNKCLGEGFKLFK